MAVQCDSINNTKSLKAISNLPLWRQFCSVYSFLLFIIFSYEKRFHVLHTFFFFCGLHCYFLNVDFFLFFLLYSIAQKLFLQSLLSTYFVDKSLEIDLFFSLPINTGCITFEDKQLQFSCSLQQPCSLQETQTDLNTGNQTFLHQVYNFSLLRRVCSNIFTHLNCIYNLIWVTEGLITVTLSF